jgi:hypothetical protein
MRRASGPPRANFIWQLSPPAASTDGGISKCGDRWVRTLLYEAANVILTRYKGQLKLKDGPSRSPSGQRCAKRESLWRAALGLSCTRCCETGQSSHRPMPRNPKDRRPNPAPRRSDAQGGSRRRRGFRSHAVNRWPTAISTRPPAPSSPHQVRNEHAKNAGTRKRRHPEEPPGLDPLENDIRPKRSSLTCESAA